MFRVTAHCHLRSKTDEGLLRPHAVFPGIRFWDDLGRRYRIGSAADRPNLCADTTVIAACETKSADRTSERLALSPPVWQFFRKDCGPRVDPRKGRSERIPLSRGQSLMHRLRCQE